MVFLGGGLFEEMGASFTGADTLKTPCWALSPETHPTSGLRDPGFRGQNTGFRESTKNRVEHGDVVGKTRGWVSKKAGGRPVRGNKGQRIEKNRGPVRATWKQAP